MTPTSATARLHPIPEPPRVPLVGHVQLLTAPSFTECTLRLAQRLGPVFGLRLFGEEMTLVSDQAVVAELCDESRFHKKIDATLERVRLLGGDGLFTAHDEEPNWKTAHDLLMPAFSLGAMRGYHDTMVEVGHRLLDRWEKHPTVDVPGDATRLTLDTIGLCGFGYDFECFSRAEEHPFVSAMVRGLAYTQETAITPPGTAWLRRRADTRFEQDRQTLTQFVDDVIAHRRAQGSNDGQDLLDRMLFPAAGQGLDVQNIRHQVITFLIAGHETTSSALSFAVYFLLKHPEVLARAQAEVDAVWGDQDRPSPAFADVGRLTWIRQVLNETLRLWPTAPAFTVQPYEDTVIGGRYQVRRGQALTISTPALHRDPSWGGNPNTFDPRRFDAEFDAQRPAHAYKPFGNGQRACIGRQFALHEAVLVLGMILHRFELVDHTDYQLKIRELLTLKPEGLTMRVRPRRFRRSTLSVANPCGVPNSGAAEVALHDGTTSAATRAAGGDLAPSTVDRLRIAHGSTMGTGRAVARDLAELLGGARQVSAPRALDDLVDDLSPEDILLVVAASYNGRPAEEATRFTQWVQDLPAQALTGVRYAVLGLGDRNWPGTYQQVPQLLDRALAAAGAERLTNLGAADAAGAFDAAVDQWTRRLHAALAGPTGVGDPDTALPAPRPPRYRVQRQAGARPVPSVREGAAEVLRVVDSRPLTSAQAPAGQRKHHVRLALPPGVTYRTGDHLLVWPRQRADLVERVARRFGLDLADVVSLTVEGKGSIRASHHLPVGRPLTVRQLLGEVLDLQRPAGAFEAAVLRDCTACPPDRRALAALADASPEDFDDVAHAPVSVVDMVERHPSCELGFEDFLGLMRPVQPRRYSISSSAVATPDTVDLAVAVVERPLPRREGAHRGTASTFLSATVAGDVVDASIAPCPEVFRLPRAADGTVSTDVVMVAAGTGVAPFRAAVAEEVHLGGTGRLTLYVGCRAEALDFLHRDELTDAAARGVVDLRPTFSQEPVDGLRYVQDRLRADGGDLWSRLQAGAHIRVCGAADTVGAGTRSFLVDLHRDHTGSSVEQSRQWLEDLVQEGRYAEDVWAS